MKKYLFLGCAFIGAMTTASTQTLAGFQFTAPAQQVKQQAVPPLNQALMPKIPEIKLEGEGEMPSAPMPSVEAATPTPLLPSPSMESAPTPRAPKTGITSLAPQAVAPAPMTSPSMPQEKSDYEMAVGFGKDLPLVTALRQVVPSQYTYILDESVPASSKVSWNGGRPWDQVLNDMITPLGLQSSIQGNRVIIRNGVQTAMAAPMPAAKAPEPMVFEPVVAPAVAPVAPIMPAYTPPAPAPTMATATPPAMQQTPSAPIPAGQTWTATRGDSLRNVLEDWSNQAGADLFWSSDYDYPLAGDVNVSGSFEDAVQNILRGFEQARPKPIGRLHPNLPNGPAVLVVETRQTLN